MEKNLKNHNRIIMKKNFTLLSFMSGSRLMMAALLFIGTTALRAQTVGESFTTADGLTYTVVSDAQPASVTVTGGSVASNILSIPATVENGGTAFAVTAIADEAFKGSNVVTLDLTAATNLQRIGVSAFAECKKLETVTFPTASESQLTEIGTLAFHHAFALKSFNLEDTRLTVLESFFSKDESDEISIEGLVELRLPETLVEIKDYALQFLDIKEIEIPSSVTTFGNCVLEGCIYLTDFTWKNAQVTRLPRYTFRGNEMKNVTLITLKPIDPDGLTDKHFYHVSSEGTLTNVIVTQESIESLATGGYTNETSKYSVLVPWSGDPNAIKSIKAEPKAKAEEPDSGDDSWYTLQGTRVDSPRKGRLYIHNGRKVVVK